MIPSQVGTPGCPCSRWPFRAIESFPSKGQWDGTEAHDGCMTKTPERPQASTPERQCNVTGKWLVLRSHNKFLVSERNTENNVPSHQPWVGSSCRSQSKRDTFSCCCLSTATQHTFSGLCSGGFLVRSTADQAFLSPVSISYTADTDCHVCSKPMRFRIRR